MDNALLSLSNYRSCIAVAVEGHAAILVLTIAARHLELAQELELSAVPQPSFVAFSTEGSCGVWVVV